MNSDVYTEPEVEETHAEMEPLPEALLGGSEALTNPDNTDSLWNRFFPREVSFFKIPLLDQLQRRPYHSVTLQGPFDVTKLVQIHGSRIFRSESSISRNASKNIERLLFCFGAGLFGYLDGERETFCIYAPTMEKAAVIAEKFRRYVLLPGARKPRFYVISVKREGICAEPVIIERSAPVTTEELSLNYGEDFLAWEQNWMKQMSKTPSGLSILFGPPGCGKTSYLRALMTRLIDQTDFYYVPVSEAQMLTDPRFVSFWLSQNSRHAKKQKIAILEDAEELLLTRDGGNREKVSNLLNIADGFLGDHLKLHVVATANVMISKLDPAITRPGRLIGIREFRRLTRQEAVRLAGAKGLKLPNQNDFSLAELYCARTDPAQFEQDKQIGFAQPNGHE